METGFADKVKVEVRGGQNSKKRKQYNPSMKVTHFGEMDELQMLLIWLYCVAWKAGDEAEEDSKPISCGILNSIL